MTNYFIHAYNVVNIKERKNMKKIKINEEELATMTYTDVAYVILKENGKKMPIQDIFESVIKLMSLPDSYFESKIADFFQLLTTDKRFIMLEKGFWDLSDNHSKQIIIETEEEEEEIAPEEEIEETDDEMEEINYDDDVVDDDDEEDDLKDLVIIDDSEDPDSM